MHYGKLFSTELGYEKKLSVLRDEFSIPVTEEISKEVLDVCNLSTGVLNKGRMEGRTEGRMEQAKDTAFRLQGKGMSLRDIAEMVDVSVSTVQEWLSEPQVTAAK